MTFSSQNLPQDAAEAVPVPLHYLAGIFVKLSYKQWHTTVIWHLGTIMFLHFPPPPYNKIWVVSPGRNPGLLAKKTCPWRPKFNPEHKSSFLEVGMGAQVYRTGRSGFYIQIVDRSTHPANLQPWLIIAGESNRLSF